MSEPVTSPARPAQAAEAADGAALYREMVRIRYFEDEIERLWKTGDIPGTIHLYQGQEAVAVGVCAALTPDDSVAATYRGHGVCLARGIDPESMFAELLGRATGVCGGRAGTMNVASLKHGVIGCYGIVGGSIGAATGAALAAQLRRSGSVAAAFFGDGAVNQAYFHECLNWASVRRLPVIYVCENNLYGEFTPMARVTAGGRIASRAAAYDLPAAEVDGNDVLAVLEAAQQAVTNAREGRGPTLLECKTYRQKGHSRGDPGTYRPKEEIAAWMERDPLLRHAQRIGEAAGQIEQEVRAEIDAALEAARGASWPDPDFLDAATKEAT
jgi:TPP-dependent pyruvate/acetoin dehydrogenase alpha subunit